MTRLRTKGPRIRGLFRPITLPRSRDPGLKLGQVGGPTWVHCPECHGPAKSAGYGVACIKCGYHTLQKEWTPSPWGRFKEFDPRCINCRHRLPPDLVVPTRFDEGFMKTFIRVQCGHCRYTGTYRGVPASPPAGAAAEELRTVKMYLTARVSGHILWVANLAHLDLLEDYLSASLRERGWVRGMTMMARLPPWMKSATMRPKVLRALGHLRERARKAGISE